MARFDVYPNPSGKGYILDVQADLLNDLNTRVVVPLLPLVSAPQPAKRLNPIFDIQGTRCVMVTQFLAAIPLRELQAAPVETLAHAHSEITDALDMVFQGF